MGTLEACTRLLGLALRGGNLVTGNDAVQAAAYAGQIRLLMISADASPHVCKDAQRWAERGNCLLIALPCDKAELGGALGRGEVAVAALTDTGLAAAVGERLAQLDPGRYTDTAERLKRKVERAGERKAARADERKTARADKRKVARADERKTARAGERKAARADERKVARADKRKVARTDERKTARAGERKAAKARARPDGTRTPDAPKRKTNAETRKTGATPRKTNAAHTTRKPAATTRKTSAPTRKSGAITRKSGAARNDKPGGTPSGRPSGRAGNPPPRRKHTDT